MLLLALAMSLSATGCASPATTLQRPATALPEVDPTAAGAMVYTLSIDGVEVTGDAIIFWGQTTLSTDYCLYTQLVNDEDPVAWWPAGKCFPVSNPVWRYAVALGEEGGETLPENASYVLKIWWPGAPGIVEDDFAFSAPQSVEGE